MEIIYLAWRPTEGGKKALNEGYYPVLLRTSSVGYRAAIHPMHITNSVKSAALNIAKSR